MPVKLGDALPARKDYFERQKPHSTHTHPINIMGGTKHLPVIQIPIGMAKYRLANGRTASMQQEYLAQNPTLDKELFTRDFESDAAHQAQHELLKKLIKNKGLLEHFRSPKQKQNEPIIVDENGFVINGNRRLCAWRELYQEDPTEYKHFEFIDAVVLPPCNEKVIDELEARLQVIPDIKDDYEWHSLAMMMKNRIANHGFNSATIADLYGMKEKDVEVLLQAHDYARAYLEKRGWDQEWSRVSQHEHSFKRIVENRCGLNEVGAKKLFEESSFVLIDDTEGGGRVYETIRLLKKHFDKVKKGLQEEFNVKPVDSVDPSLSLLGSIGVLPPSIDMPLAEEVERECNRAKVREIVREVIASQEQLDKDKDSANFMLKRLQKANSLVTDVCNLGLRPESMKDGVKEQVANIERGLAIIKEWLGSNA